MKVSIFIPYWTDDSEEPFKELPEIYPDDLIRTKREAIKAVAFLTAEWNIKPENFVAELVRLQNDLEEERNIHH